MSSVDLSKDPVSSGSPPIVPYSKFLSKDKRVGHIPDLESKVPLRPWVTGSPLDKSTNLPNLKVKLKSEEIQFYTVKVLLLYV